MSQENVDIVKRAHAALSRGDTEAFIREMDERIEGMSRVMDAEGITYSGHDGIRRFVADLLSVFPDFRSEVVNAVEDNATVVAELRFGGSATRSALAVEGRTWQALTFRGGKILSFRAYETEAEALEAVGLRE